MRGNNLLSAENVSGTKVLKEPLIPNFYRDTQKA